MYQLDMITQEPESACGLCSELHSTCVIISEMVQDWR